MKAIWTILIDISGSMAGPFSGEKEPVGLPEVGSWKFKIEAAKEILIRQVMNLPSVDVAIISFSDDAELIYIGPSDNLKEIEKKVYDLETDDMTNVAGALYKAIEVIDPKKYDSVSILVISDGLSNVGNPEEAAQTVINEIKGSRISTILIDRTSEGERIAYSISIGGEVRDGTTYSKLMGGFKGERAETIRSAIHTLESERISLESALAESLDYSRPSILQFKGTDEVQFRSDFIGTYVLPYMSSLENLQRVTHRIEGKPTKIKVHSISHYSPIKASVSGIAQALNILDEKITPWKRQHSKKISKLREEEIRINNQKTKAEMLEIEARSLLSVKEADKIMQEARLMKAQAEQQEIQNEKEKFKLRKSQVRLALDILKELKEDRLEFEHPTIMAYINEILEPLKIISESPIEVEVQHNMEKMDSYH